jgi:hypothetical protein
METVKRLAGVMGLIAVVSFCMSVAVFSWMRGDAR